MKTQTTLKASALICSALASVSSSQASTDYGPAIWRPICNANWYTSGYGKKFYVIHDIEGYYASVLTYFAGCGFTSASVHYAINGKQDTTSDYAPGEVSQFGVADANYAWHALCWSQHSMGTEHEGFASNPAWYTTQMYQSSAALTASKATKYGFPKTRNYIVAHGEKIYTPSWPAWANANLGINGSCQTHSDPGPYWDWNYYMSLVTGTGTPVTPVRRPFGSVERNKDGRLSIFAVGTAGAVQLSWQTTLNGA